MNERLNAIVGARIGEFRRKMAEVKRSLATVPRNIKTDIDVEVDKFNRKIDNLASRIRNLGVVMGNAFKGGLISILPGLSPIIGSLVGSVGGLASSFTALGGASGAFGVAAIGNATALAESMDEVQKINDKIKSERQGVDPDQERINELLHEREHILGEMSDAQKDAMKQVSSFKDAWSDFLKVTQEPVFNVFAKGLELATSLLDKMEPIVKPASQAIANLLEQFNNFTGTKQFRSFVDFFATRGVSAIENWGQIIGNIFVGFMEMMKAFGPLGKDMENGLIGMTKSFSEWAAGLSESKSFQNFVDFVKTNGPKVLDLIGNLTMFIIELGKGMAPLGSSILDTLNNFYEWMNGMMRSNSAIGKVIAWMTTLGGALLAIAPVVLLLTSMFSAIIKVVGRLVSVALKPLGKLFTFLATKVRNASLALTILGKGALTAILGPILAVVAVISLLVAVFVRLWNENEKFRQGVINAWNIIKTTIMTVVNFIAELVRTVIGALVTWWQENQQQILSAAQQVWNTIYNTIVTILTTIWNVLKTITDSYKDLWEQHGDTIMAIVKVAWKYIESVVIATFGTLKAFIKAGMRFIKGVFQTVWPIISGLVQIAWGIIEGVIKSGIDIATGIINTGMNILKGDWEGAWDSIKDTAMDIMDNVIDFFKSVDLFEIGSNIIDGLINGIKSMGGAAVDAAKGIGSSVKDGFTNFFGISSPSKLMEKDVGRWVTEGMGEGMLDKIRSISKTAKQVAQAATPQMQNMQIAGMDVNSRDLASVQAGLNVDQYSNIPDNYEQQESNTFNFERLFDGADISVRDERDIQEIARELGEHVKGVKRGKGRR